MFLQISVGIVGIISVGISVLALVSYLCRQSIKTEVEREVDPPL